MAEMHEEALLNDEIVQNVREMLDGLENEVKLVLFTDDQECEYCPQIVQLLEEVSATSDQVSLQQHEIHESADQAKAYNIEKAPAIIILGQKDYGLRFYGIPSGYEFSTLLHAIQRVGNGGQSELDEQTKQFLGGLDDAVHLQVFVTPTCPYCPRSAVLAMEMAMESENVRADVIESAEFPEWASKFNVMGVPLNVINGQERVEGAAPAPMIIDAIRKTI